MSPKGQLLPLRRAEGTADSLSDEALVAACGVGDSSALGALFDRHHQAVFRFLSRLTRGSAQDMDDLAQTTFLEVWRSAKAYSGRSAVRTWILGIAANLSRHHGRAEARRRNAHRGFASTAATTSRTRPDEQALRQQLVERLGDELERLGHDQRVAFVMCDLEGLSGVEAARALDIREGTLWRRLHEARKALRHVLGGEP